MRQKSEITETTSEHVAKNIRRATRKHHSAEEKIRIVLDGLRGKYSIAEPMAIATPAQEGIFNRQSELKTG